MPGSERVFDVYDYWDGPKSGVADFKGQPHLFECIFDDRLDEWSWFYLLKPIEQETLQLVMERHEIWLRWQDAYHHGRVAHDSYPLPADQPRRLELDRILSARLELPSSGDLAAYAEFDRLGPPGVSGPWGVTWAIVPRASLGHVERVGSYLRSSDIDPDLYQRRHV